MYILRAFPLSLSILWRYALVFPLLVMVLCVYGIIAVMFGFIFGLISPALAILIAVTLGLASGVMPVMIGTRIGMQARGVQPRNSYAGLILPAIGYGLFEGFCILLIFILALGAVTLATPLSLMEMLGLNASGSDAVFARLLEENAPVTLAAFALASFWAVAVRSALLVPFVGASIGIDPSGRAHTPFYGFASGFWSMMILVIISYVGGVLAVPLISMLAQTMGYGDAIADGAQQLTQFGDELEDEVQLDLIGGEAIVLVGGTILVMLWFFSVQCAGAVLVFLNHKKAYDIQHEDYNKPAEADIEPPMPKTDMRELIRSRMPHNHR